MLTLVAKRAMTILYHQDLNRSPKQEGGLGKIIYQVKPGKSIINDQICAGTALPHRNQVEL